MDEMTHYRVGHGSQEYGYYRDCDADIAAIGVAPKDADRYLVDGQGRDVDRQVVENVDDAFVDGEEDDDDRENIM